MYPPFREALRFIGMDVMELTHMVTAVIRFVMTCLCCRLKQYIILNILLSPVRVTLQLFNSCILIVLISGLHGLIVGGASGVFNIFDQVCNQGTTGFQCIYICYMTEY